MIKILLPLLFCACLSHAQQVQNNLENKALPENAVAISTNRLLTEQDFKKMEGRMIVTDIPCTLKVGSKTSQIKVSVVCQQNAFKELGLERINKLITTANEKVYLTMGNQRNFKPTEIRISYNPMLKDWNLTHAFSTEAEDGSTNDSQLALDFDAAGEYKKMRRVY